MTSTPSHVLIPSNPTENAPQQSHLHSPTNYGREEIVSGDGPSGPQHAIVTPAVPSSPAQERNLDIQAVRLRDTRTEFTLPIHRLSSNPRQSPPSTVEKLEDGDDPFSGTQELHYGNGYNGNNQPLPPMPGEVPSAGSNRRRMGPQRTGTYLSRRSEVDWVEGTEKTHALTVAGRLAKTVLEAETARDKAFLQAKWSGYILNAAIGLQVLLGSLTTGLSAVATQGKSAAVSTTILGALATVVASYLARARGSGEPEASNARVTALNSFLRRCENFRADYGHIIGSDKDDRIAEFRKELEYLLNGSGDAGEGRPVPSQISRTPGV